MVWKTVCMPMRAGILNSRATAARCPVRAPWSVTTATALFKRAAHCGKGYLATSTAPGGNCSISTVDSIGKAGPQATPGLAVIPPSKRIGCSNRGPEKGSSRSRFRSKDQ